MKIQESYSEFKTSSGQVSLLPSVNTIINQGPGYCKDGTNFNYDENNPNKSYAYSHQFYRAIDLHTRGKELRAPFDCKCVHFSYEGFSTVEAAVFQSLKEVICPSSPNAPCYVSFMV